ncbi:MAG: NAD(P)-dependent oxidoreductase, partial [Actinomycetota bacterium]|nr:NAD(P)-dependent oxidoreductase [Actinomycetota bacterium]
MGTFLGTAVAAAGHEVLWVGAGRSAATRERAAGFTEV